MIQSGDVLELSEESALVTGQVTHGGILVDGLGVGDVAAVVGSALLEDLLHAVLSAESLDEVVHQADGVVVAAVKHDGGGFGFQIAGGQIGPDHPLEAVREADPADVGMVAGDAVVGGGGGDQRGVSVVQWAGGGPGGLLLPQRRSQRERRQRVGEGLPLSHRED